MIARAALRYLAVFAAVLALLSAGAYVFVSRQYVALLGPALPTPEGHTAYAHAMQRVIATIISLDLPLLLLFAAASWLLAKMAIDPLVRVQERERIFAADSAHALRSPLATIASTAQAARNGADPQTASALEVIARAALDASNTVGQLLTLARSASSGALEREPIDLGAVVNDVAKEFQARANERAVALETEHASAIVQADERRVRELTRNLIDNALRHAFRSVKVRVDAPGDMAELHVWNDGEPISDGERARVFERFYTGDGTAGGSGLGLAIVHWIAQAHGGSVAVTNGSAAGTEFIVRLPLVST